MLSRGLARALPLVAVQTKQALPRVNYTMCKRTTATEAIRLPTTAYQTLAFYEPPPTPNPAEAAVRTMADGKLVSDQLVATMLESYLRTSACEGWVLDGFPRNATQAKMLFSNMGTTPDLVVELVVSHDDIRERLQYRRVDPVTGAVYNLAGERPSDTAVLARLEKRTDDCAEVIERRLRVYEEAMPAIRQVFRSHGVAIAQVVAEGGASVEDVARAVSKVAQGKRIVLAGAPGCGKGTQGVLLAEAIGGKHVSTGDLLRKAARLASEGLASGLEQKDVGGAVLRL